MSKKFSVKVVNMTTAKSLNGLNNVVTAVNWLASLTDGSTTVFQAGRNKVNPPNVSAFVPYSQLTEDKVLSWIPDPLSNPDLIAILNDRLAKAASAEPTGISSPPWLKKSAS